MKFLIEKLPRDLAKAYRNDSSRRREMSHHNFFRDDDDIDYEKAEYKEITPEEAIALRKSGKAETIRALIGGDWVEYYKDGSANRNINISQWYSKLYKTKSGRIITNTQHMPFSHVMHIADKIYATNENETKIDPEKMKRRELTQDYEHPSKGSWYNHDYGDRIALHGNNRGSGDHTAMSDYRKRDYKNDLKKINELTKELKDPGVIAQHHSGQLLVGEGGDAEAVLSVGLARLLGFATPWTAAHQASLSITNSQSLLRLMPIESVMPSNHLILCQPLLLLPSIFPSIRVYSDRKSVV